MGAPGVGEGGEGPTWVTLAQREEATPRLVLSVELGLDSSNAVLVSMDVLVQVSQSGLALLEHRVA